VVEPPAAPVRDCPGLVQINCDSRRRRSVDPSKPGAIEMLIGAYRAFRSTAAVTAAATLPPSSRIEAAANCAEPANVVAA
jgi:hypothetical protein